MTVTELVTKTGAEIWEALNTFGLHHVREVWLQQNGVKVDACILGGTAYNLSVAPTADFTDDYQHSLEGQLGTVHVSRNLAEEYGVMVSDYGPTNVADFIMAVNDKRLDNGEGVAKYGDDFWHFAHRDERNFKFNFFEIKEAARKALEPYANHEFTFRAINLDPLNVEASFAEGNTWDWEAVSGESGSR